MVTAIVGEMGHLEGNLPAELFVLGQVDSAHASLTELADQTIVPQARLWSGRGWQWYGILLRWLGRLGLLPVRHRLIPGRKRRSNRIGHGQLPSQSLWWMFAAYCAADAPVQQFLDHHASVREHSAGAWQRAVRPPRIQRSIRCPRALPGLLARYRDPLIESNTEVQ